MQLTPPLMVHKYELISSDWLGGLFASLNTSYSFYFRASLRVEILIHCLYGLWESVIMYDLSVYLPGSCVSGVGTGYPIGDLDKYGVKLWVY